MPNNKPTPAKRGRKAKKSRSRVGSVDMLPSGRWRARVTETDGTRTNLGTHDTDTTAWDAVNRYLGMTALDLHIDRAKSQAPLSEVYEAYLRIKSGEKGTVLDRAQFANRVIYGTADRTHPADVLGNKPVGSLTRDNLVPWAHGLTARGLGPRTVGKWVGMLSAVLDYAADGDHVRKNPINGQRGKQGMVPPIPHRDHYLLTLDEMVAWTWAATPDHALMHETTLWNGLRQGEVRGLTPRSLMLDTNELWIETSPDGTDLVEGVKTTKTRGSVRKVKCPDRLFAALVTHAEHIDPASPLFPNPTGGWLSATWFSHDVQDTRLRAGLTGDPRSSNPGRRRPPTAHDARSTAASFLSAAGVPPVEAQTYLGHSSSTTTLDVYTEVSHHLNRDVTIRAARLAGLDAGQVMELLYTEAWGERAEAVAASFNMDAVGPPAVNRGGRPARKPGEPWNTGARWPKPTP